MILTTHAIAGAAAASLMPQRPVLGFVVAFLSHFILDAIPHWEYEIKSDSINPLVSSSFIYDRKLFIDILRIGSDIASGLILSLVFFYPTVSFLAVFIGVVGGIMPDALQFIYGKIKKEPLVSLQRFHMWIHARTKLIDRPILGVISQVLLIVIVVFVARFVMSG